MRLLVTRPEPEATTTAERLRAAGHEVLVQPLLTVVFSPPLANLPTPAGIMVTSQNAVRAMAGWPELATWRRVPVFAAGPATAEAVRAHGFTDVRAAAGDARSLGGRVSDDLPPDAGPLLYPAARDRAGDLAERLIALGYNVRVVEAYRAHAAADFIPPVRAALSTRGLDGILLYSRRTAEAFRALATAAAVDDRLTGIAWYVISPRVADVLAGLGGEIHVAREPDEESLLALISPAGGQGG